MNPTRKQSREYSESIWKPHTMKTLPADAENLKKSRESQVESLPLPESLSEILGRRVALERELAKVKASDEYNFGILKKCHAILGMADDQSYSLIPGEIEEWICSHGLVKDKQAKASDRAVYLQQALDADKAKIKALVELLGKAAARLSSAGSAFDNQGNEMMANYCVRCVAEIEAALATA